MTTKELMTEAANLLNTYVMRDAENAYQAALLNTPNHVIVPGLENWVDEGAMRLIQALYEAGSEN